MLWMSSMLKKLKPLGADGIIAVNKEAGGHAGPKSYKELIPALKEACTIPILSAGGIGDGKGIKDMLDLGAGGVSMGSVIYRNQGGTRFSRIIKMPA